jgi:hypothetical protein
MSMELLAISEKACAYIVINCLSLIAKDIHRACDERKMQNAVSRCLILAQTLP